MFDTLFRATRNRWLLALMLVPFAMRFILVWQEFSVLVKQSALLEDDCFYYLSIAQHFCAGHGFTVDGQIPTTGFQLLHEILCIALTYIFSPDSFYPFRILLTLQVIISLGCLAVLMDNVRIFLGETEALIAGFVFSWWLPVFRHGNNGLETVLQILMILLLIRFSYNYFVRRSNHDMVLLALTCATSIFVRIDMIAFPVAFIAVATMSRVEKRLASREAVKAIATVTLSSAIALGALFLLDYSINQHFLPDSGIAVKELATDYIIKYFGGSLLSASPRRALSVLLGDQPYDQMFQVVRIPLHPRLELTGLFVTLTILLFMKMRQKFSDAFRAQAMLVAIYGVILASFYTFYLPAIWHFSRYLFTVAVLSLLIVVPVLKEYLLRLQTRIHQYLFISLVLSGCAWYMAAGTQRWIHFMVDPFEQISDADLENKTLSETHVSHNYDIGRWVRYNIPANKRIAMWQNGLAGYVSRRNIVHVDGLVNRYAVEAWATNHLDDYLKKNQIDYLIDFQPVTEIAVRHSQHPAETYELIGLSVTSSPSLPPVAIYRINR